MSDMERDFSDGFVDDLLYLIRLCMANDTDNVRLSREIDGTVISVDMTFSIEDSHKE